MHGFIIMLDEIKFVYFYNHDIYIAVYKAIYIDCINFLSSIYFI